MDKVLVVSNHAKTSLVDTVATAKNNQTGEEFPYRCETPVEVVWENTPRHEPEEINGFELQYDNNFLVVSQMGPRKNFENTVKWFVEEFIDQEVGLVIKTNVRSNCLMDFEATENILKNMLSNYPEHLPTGYSTPNYSFGEPVEHHIQYPIRQTKQQASNFERPL